MKGRSPLLIGTLLAALLLSRAALPADDYLADSRTARGVSFRSPRAPLQECLRVLSETVQVPLTLSPTLAGEPLVGYVPRRPLRETMQALETLYDAVWTRAPGNPPGYRLEPDPARHRAAAAARAAALNREQKSLDALAADALRELKSGKPLPKGDALSRLFIGYVWGQFPPMERERVLQGAVVTAALPEAHTAPVYALIVQARRQERLQPSGSAIATMDLEDRYDRGTPSLRVRATVAGEGWITGGIELLELARAEKPRAAAPVIPQDSPALPMDVGGSGRFEGERDEMLVRAAIGCGVPILSRHRAYGGSSGVAAGGRQLAQVIADLAVQCEATPAITARGYHLLRSQTAPLDPSGLPASSIVDAYLKARPADGKPVPFRVLAALGALSPLQLAILQRSNLCTDDATVAREAYALLRFYRSLTAAQQAALFSREGLEAASLTHAQLHTLLDTRDKRGDFDIINEVRRLRGLRFRFQERAGEDEDHTLFVQALRNGAPVSSASVELPLVSAEEQPRAER